jgi:DNA polymerase-3 subunit gamma/tau
MFVAHLALYREFRPQRFADVVGQQHITRTLRNALVQNRMHHAYLLSGPRGTGKTTVARILAKAVNCLDLKDGEPCNECAACRSIISGETMDVIEIDAASNRGIDEIRDLREKVKYAPADLKRKVYIIDEVHMLSEPAFNALLKTLEEPPAHVLFVLATTEKHKLPVTIISRCQCFDYHRLAVQEIVDRLRLVCEKYQIKATEEALTAIARQAEGGMRDALSLLDQVMAFAVENQITLEDTLHVLGSAPLQDFLKLDRHLSQGDVGGALLLLDELIRQGKDLRQFVRDYLAHMRDLLLLKVDPQGAALDLPGAAKEAIADQSRQLRQDQILGAIHLLAQLETDLRFTSSPRLLVEVGLIRLAGLYTQPPQPVMAPTAAPVLAAPGTQVAAGTQAAVQETQPGPAGQAGVQPPAQADAGASPGRGAPAGRPAAQPAPAPTGEGIERVLQVWDQVVDLVRRARPSTHMLLSQTRIARLRGNQLILVAQNAAFADLLKRPQDKSIMEKALERVGLSGIEVYPVGPDDPAAKVEAAPPPAAAEEAEGSLLDVVQRIFPKELVQEIKEEGSK